MPNRTSCGRRITGLPAIDEAMTLGAARYRRAYSARSSGLAINSDTSFPPKSGLYGATAPHTVMSIMSTPTCVAFVYLRTVATARPTLAEEREAFQASERARLIPAA